MKLRDFLAAGLFGLLAPGLTACDDSTRGYDTGAPRDAQKAADRGEPSARPELGTGSPYGAGDENEHPAGNMFEDHTIPAQETDLRAADETQQDEAQEIADEAQQPKVEAVRFEGDNEQLHYEASRALTQDLAQYKDVDVRVEGGTAILSGFVASEEAKRSAEGLVKGVPGIGALRNELQIRQPRGKGDQGNADATRPVPDAKLEEQVKRIVGDPASGVKLSVARGAVTIRGEVEDYAQAVTILDSVRKIDGVLQIKDELTIRQAQGPQAPGAAPKQGAPQGSGLNDGFQGAPHQGQSGQGTGGAEGGKD
jgi:osmotically-inducible protein OsmY